MLGWIYRESAYCQLIRTVNKIKRLEWARNYLHDNFEDVIWTDETTVQLQTHRRFCCRKEGEKPRLKPCPKHPIKVHVWAGISKKGATKACIFEELMNASLYCEILQKTLLPFFQENFHHLLLTISCRIPILNTVPVLLKNYTGTNWWHTPPESPDANPIEKLWHEMKEFIQREVKPTTKKQQLVDGISSFWDSVDVRKCCRYIENLKKVLPRIIEKGGGATGC